MAETGKAPVEAPQKKKSGCLKNAFFLALLALIVLGGLGYITFLPQDLSDIDGYAEKPSPIGNAGRDLAAVLDAASKNGQTVTITEAELNAYLVRTLKFRQEGVFKGHVEARGVWVRLEEGVAEVVIERELMGERRHTISMYLKPEQDQGEDGSMLTKVHRSSGRFGRVRVFRGFMLLTKSSFESLASVYSDELMTVQRMFKDKVRIKIKEGALELSAPE